MIFFQILYDGVSGIQIHGVCMTAGVTVGNRHFYIFCIAVGIHVGGNVEPCIERRENADSHHDESSSRAT